MTVHYSISDLTHLSVELSKEVIDSAFIKESGIRQKHTTQLNFTATASADIDEKSQDEITRLARVGLAADFIKAKIRENEKKK